MPVLLALMAVLMLALSPLAADARGAGQGSGVTGGVLTADEAARQAQARTGGRVLAVEADNGGYRVKILTSDGEVRFVFIGR